MSRTPRPSRRRPPHGMTLLELSAALVVITLVLGACVIASDNLVNDSAKELTVKTMHTINHALGVYRAEHGVWPSATEPGHIDTPMARCIAALRSSPKTEPLVADLPGLTTTPAGWLTVRDGWGRVMVYVVPTDDNDATRDWLRRLAPPHVTHPFIASAGLDGKFGDVTSTDSPERTASLDNLYTFDLESMK